MLADIREKWKCVGLAGGADRPAIRESRKENNSNRMERKVVVSTAAKQLVTTSTPAINTGGSFTARKTLVGTVTLAAGTWLVDADFTATPNANTAGDVFPQLFVYDGPVNSGFTNDLFNVGAGALEDPTATIVADGDTINSYYSGESEITVPSGGETLDVYAFGYDSDTGEGSYALNSAVITATHLQTAS